MRAKVYNDNTFPHKEYFKGETVSIPAGEFIEMDYDEAIEFRGQFTSIVRDADNQPKKESFKMIRVVPLGNHLDAASKSDPNKCLGCGKTLGSQGELAQHIFDVHPEQMDPASKDEAVKALNKMKGK